MWLVQVDLAENRSRIRISVSSRQPEQHSCRVAEKHLLLVNMEDNISTSLA